MLNLWKRERGRILVESGFKLDFGILKYISILRLICITVENSLGRIC